MREAPVIRGKVAGVEMAGNPGFLGDYLHAEVYYRSTDRGQEKVIGERLAWWKRLVFRDEASVPRGDG